LQDEKFTDLLKKEWHHFDPQKAGIEMFQFHANLQKVKKATVELAWRSHQP
jgi:hypothetical protein